MPNSTRVETFGTPYHHWLRATIDPEDPDVLSVEQVLVEGNTAPPEQTPAP